MVESANKESYNKIFSKLKEHHKWFENSIPLIASENISKSLLFGSQEIIRVALRHFSDRRSL